jgi:dihydroorotase
MLMLVQVASLPLNIACTITAHHLHLTIDDVAPQPYHYCKPIAKEPRDRAALQAAIISGNPKFFLGSDSAPHPMASKTPSIASVEVAPSPCAAGVYTSPILIPLVATLLESFGALDKLEGFVSIHGRKFYGVEPKKGKELRLRRSTGKKVVSVMGGEGGVEVVPFWAGKELGWEIV